MPTENPVARNLRAAELPFPKGAIPKGAIPKGVIPKGPFPPLLAVGSASILPAMLLAIRVVAYAAVAVTLLALALFLFRLPGGAGSRGTRAEGGPADDGGSPRAKRSKARVGAGGGVAPRTCPVCGSTLAAGERIHSRVFTPKGDRIMHVYGCPRCWPANVANVRVCPVCEKYVPRGGFLVARYFEQPNRRHVHVLGCSGCRFG